MPDDDAWSGTGYVRVYATLARDHPMVWDDPRLLGWYVRLLLPADQAWPSLAEVPRAAPDDVLDDLVADQVIDRVGASRYRFHGLTHERAGRGKRGYIGGKVRASVAGRDSLGRFAGDAGYAVAGPVAGQSSADAGPTLVTGAGPLAGSSLDDISLDQRSAVQRSSTTEPSSSRSGTLNGSPDLLPERESNRARERSTTPRADRPARAAPDPQAIECDDYQAHRADHRWVEGVGWKCVTCEANRALSEPTFREKVERAGGAW